MKRALFFILLLTGFLCLSKSLRALGQLYAFAFRSMQYDHIEKEGPYIEVKRGFGEILAIDRRVFPGEIPIHIDLCRPGRKTTQVSIDGKEYIQKSFVEKGLIKAFFFPSRGLSFWNNGWLLQGKVETIKPALVFSKREGFTQISTVLYPLEGKRMRDAAFDPVQKELDQRSFTEIENRLKEHRIYHADLMIWNFIQIEGEGLKVVDLEDVTPFPKYSPLFLKMHRRDKKKLHLSEEAYQKLAALQTLQ